MLRYHPTVPGHNYPSEVFPEDVPPVDFVAQLARLGIRLRDDGSCLVVVGPNEIEEKPWWPELDRLIAHWAPWIADTVAVVQEVGEDGTPEEIREFLASLREPLVRTAWKAVGGRERFEKLLGGEPLAGANLTLAWIATAEIKKGLEAIALEQKALHLEVLDPRDVPLITHLMFVELHGR
jgi:hypothetical protein